MPLTTSDTFSRILISLRGGPTIKLYHEKSDRSYGNIYFEDGVDVPSGHADRADLDVLQEIYASADGFQDDDGNDIAVRVTGFHRGGLAIRDAGLLEANGFPNVLIPGSIARAGNMDEVLGALLLEGTVDEDATTARRDIVLKGGLIPETRTPASGALDVSLADINIIVFSSTTFITQLLFSSDEAPTDATLGDSPT